MKYLIPGEPVSYSKANYSKKEFFGPCQELQLITRIYLEQQHFPQPAYDIPMKINLLFYFKHPHCHTTPTYFAINTPDIINLVRFYEIIGTGIIWKNQHYIINISAEKFYSNKPHTELTVDLLQG